MQAPAARGKVITIDADGHVLEPRDVWQRYLEPTLRERAIRIARDDDGVETLLVDGRSHVGLRGRLGALGGIGMDSADLMTVGQRSYEDGCPKGGYDPSARLTVMDDEKIDVVLLYPTIGIAWEAWSPTHSSQRHIVAPTTAGSSTSAASVVVASYRSHTSL